MAIVETTSKKFKKNQKDFFELADNGDQVIIKRGSKQAYVLTPVSTEDLYFSPEMIQHIKDSEQEIQDGKVTTIKSRKELKDFFNKL